MPSSTRLYIAPEGQEATHEGLRQCSQIRGRQNMKVSSNSAFTCWFIFFRTGSSAIVSVEPPSMSSQFADHSMAIGSPEMSDFGRATGVWVESAGADRSMSYS